MRAGTAGRPAVAGGADVLAPMRKSSDRGCRNLCQHPLAPQYGRDAYLLTIADEWKDRATGKQLKSCTMIITECPPTSLSKFTIGADRRPIRAAA